MSFIKVSNIKKSYGPYEILKGFDFELKEGEQYVIQGASGSGKSTLLYLLGGLDRPTDGTILVQNENLSHLDDTSLAIYRNKFVGFIFQFHFLLPSMKSMNNVLLPAQIANIETDLIEKEMRELAKELGVYHCLDKFPYELSGGEQQRISLLRAVSLKPKLLLCDEPTGNLDSENSKTVTVILKDLAKSYNSTLVFVTHDDKVASNFKNHFVMKDGIFIQ